MISPLVIMVPLYRYMDRVGLTDSHFGAAVIYIAIAAPLFTWMLKGFLDGIPQSLEDAAMIDGCTRFGAFMRVVLPLSLPGLTSAFVLNAILGWSQFIIPFILLSKPNLLPISVGIFNFQGTYNQTSTQILAAASVLSIVPAVVRLPRAAALHHRRPDGRRGQGLTGAGDARPGRLKPTDHDADQPATHRPPPQAARRARAVDGAVEPFALDGWTFNGAPLAAGAAWPTRDGRRAVRASTR